MTVFIRDFSREIPGQLTADNMAWEFPTIETTTATGRKSEWQIIVKLSTATDAASDAFIEIEPIFLNNNHMDNGIVAWIKVRSGLVGGKTRKSMPTIVSQGKNKGKKSETNVLCQALRDALGIYRKQSRKAGGVRLPPMLAQLMPADFDAAGFVQRKYDGLRIVTCLEDGAVVCYSRRTIAFPGLDYLKTELLPILQRNPDLHFDGEIYKHGISLQEINRHARPARDDGQRFNYMVYDCFKRPIGDVGVDKTLFSQRYSTLQTVLVGTIYSQCVETFTVANRAEINQRYEQFLAEGYEGAIFRADAEYVFSKGEYRSRNLLKMKPTLDDEFRIVGWQTGTKGKAADALMIVCETADQSAADTRKTPKQFAVTPAAETADREELARKMEQVESNGKTHFENEWLGAWITVYYDALSLDGVPQRARTRLEKRID